MKEKLDSDIVLARLSSEDESFLGVSSDPLTGWDAGLVLCSDLGGLLSDFSGLG